MNKRKAIVENSISKEQRVVFLPTVISKPWVLKEILRRAPVATFQPDPLVLNEDPRLKALMEKHNLDIFTLLEKGRSRFGRNISLDGLIRTIEARGL